MSVARQRTAPVAHTALHLEYGGHMSGVRKTLYVDSLHNIQALARYFRIHPSAIFHQHRMEERHLHDKVRLIKRLGQGSYGAAFLCRIPSPVHAESAWGIHGRECVIKLSPDLLQQVQLVDGKVLATILLPDAPAHNNTNFRKTCAAFREEVGNAEMMLEPESAREFRHAAALQTYSRAHDAEPIPKREWFQKYLIGTRLRNLSGSQYFQMMKDLHAMRLHPGA